MSAQGGLPYTPADLNFKAGKLIRDLREKLIEIDELRKDLLGIQDADLVAAGATQAHLDNIRSAYNAELPAVKAAYEENRTFCDRLDGI